MKLSFGAIALVVLLAPTSADAQSDDAIERIVIRNHTEGWAWFLKLRESHATLRKLHPQLAAEWWQRQGNEVWPGIGRPYLATVTVTRGGLIGVKVHMDDPAAWRSLAALLGRAAEFHPERVDPHAPPPPPEPDRGKGPVEITVTVRSRTELGDPRRSSQEVPSCPSPTPRSRAARPRRSCAGAGPSTALDASESAAGGCTPPCRSTRSRGWRSIPR